MFIIIGVNDCREPYFPPEIKAAIARGKVFSGGRRHREIVCRLLPEGSEWIDITAPLQQVFSRYRECLGRWKEQGVPAEEAVITVFASGDPLFFGFATTLQREMPGEEIRLYPAFNSLQTLAHRLLMPYHDMRTVSLTGRPWQGLDRALIERSAKIGVLTDREHTPDAIARRMLEYGYRTYTVYTGEHLGNPERERIRRLTLEEAAQGSFEQPNCVLLHSAAPLPPRPFGIADSLFEHLEGRPNMITKASIRLLTLQALGLGGRHTLWDVGFCTGSVSIEARLQFPHLAVVSFEVRPEGERLMHANARRFGTPGITMLIGNFLRLPLDGLPRPDALFIGGHGGQLPALMQRAEEALLPGGCMVFNSVSAESKDAFLQAAARLGMKVHPPVRIALDDYNPINILKAEK